MTATHDVMLLNPDGSPYVDDRVEFHVIRRGSVPTAVDVFTTEAAAIAFQTQLRATGVYADVVVVTFHQETA